MFHRACITNCGRAGFHGIHQVFNAEIHGGQVRFTRHWCQSMAVPKPGHIRRGCHGFPAADFISGLLDQRWPKITVPTQRLARDFFRDTSIVEELQKRNVLLRQSPQTGANERGIRVSVCRIWSPIKVGRQWCRGGDFGMRRRGVFIGFCWEKHGRCWCRLCCRHSLCDCHRDTA